MINLPKSQPAPECLAIEKAKANGDYKCGTVIIRIQTDFKNKCYLCEEREPSSINVEHFVPHKENKDLKFAWDNLYYACQHCNNTKLAYSDILDPTNENIPIHEQLRFELKPFPKEKPKIKAIPDSQTARSTANLLNRIYNGTTKLKITEGTNICDKLVRELNTFNNLLHHFYYEPGLNEDEKNELKSRIRRMLSIESSFTSFKRQIIYDNEVMREEFADFI
jgi:hypothetical protein